VSDREEAEPKAPARARGTSGFDRLPDWVGPTTRLVHGARRPDWNAGAVVPPIYQTTTFHYPAEFSEAAERGDVHLYTRLDNPSLEVPAELLRALERAEAATVFGSGMGAISTSFLALLRPQDTVVALESLYGGTLDFLRDIAPRLGIRVRWVSDAEAAEPEACVPEGAALVHLESPTNPQLRVHDLRRWAEAAHRRGAKLFVDNTFATPINQNPLELGADLVLHSATKYLGGHADVTAGAVAGSEELVGAIEEYHHTLGAALDPFAAFLLARGLRTLALRLDRQNENGRRISEALASHRRVEAVRYPGRWSEREEEICRRQMRGRGGMVAITVRGGAAGARRFLRHLRLVHVASSFGGVESLVSVPSETSQRHLSADELRARGIDEGMVRLSLGIEDTEDLLRDLTDALEA
jgi:cystathionine gamma-synthase